MNKAIGISNWSLEWDSETGLPVSLTKKGGQGFFFTGPVITFFTGGITPRNNREQMYDVVGCETHGRDSRIIGADFRKGTFHITTDLGKLCLDIDFVADSNVVQLIFTLTNTSDTVIRMRHGVWRTGFIRREDFGKYSVIAPGYSPNMNEPYNVFKNISAYNAEEFLDLPCYGGGGSPGYRPGILGVHNGGTGLVSWYVNDLFSCHIQGFGVRGDSVECERRVYCPCDIAPGETLTLEGFRLGIASGTRADMIQMAAKEFARWSCPLPATHVPLCVMEVCVGQKMGRTAFEGYDDILCALPGIAEMGFNALEIMPAMPFPSYSTFNLMDIETTYGDEEGLRRVTEAAHQLGMRVICDIVLHGPLEYDPAVVLKQVSPYLTEHPDWFMRHETGEPGRTYTRSLDMGDPRYQRHVADVMLNLIRSVGVDGFRLDAQMWCEFPSWKPNSGRKPYESIFAGFVMQDFCRDIVLKEYPGTCFYTETNGPLAARGHEYRYNYDHHWIWPGLVRFTDPRGMAAGIMNFASVGTLSWSDCAKWLEETRLALPEGLTIIHHVDSHDAHEWLGCMGGQFNREAFGIQAHRALMGLVAFMDGGFMSYYGAQEGSEEFYRAVLTTRNLPVMQSECLYTACRTDHPKCALILRRNSNEWAIFAANLVGEKIRATCQLSAGIPPLSPLGVQHLAGEGILEGVAMDGKSLEIKLDAYNSMMIMGSFK